MKYIDLFAGVGGFHYGIDRAVNEMELRRRGQEKNKVETSLSDIISQPNERQFTASCVYSNEWDKYANQCYRQHFGECDNRDIRTVPTSDIPDHDLLCGGFPCQAFSVAGKRGGFNDTRGTLFYEIARILADKRPRYLLLENVKGLLSHDSGKTFQTILRVLTDLGYDIQWQVLNSKDFGVPQNRERVFIVGHLRGEPRPKVFPIGSGNSEDDGERVLAHTLNSTDWRGANRNQKQTTIRTDESDTRKGGDQSNSTNGIRRTSYTDGMRIRRLTPMECERLQGFPDNWTAGFSDTQRYKMMGNAVTTNVITAIVNKL